MINNVFNMKKKYYNNKIIFNQLKERPIVGGQPNVDRKDIKKFYITHLTSFSNMKQILKSNILSANIHLDKKYWRLSGYVPSKYIFTNMIINEKTNDSNGPRLIFDGDILYNESFYFNPGWIGDPYDKSIHIDKDFSKKDKTKKIKKIIVIVDSMVDEPDNIYQGPQFMRHEILFEDKIDLKYLIGINCVGCTKKEVGVIKKLLEKNNRKEVKIYTGVQLPVI